MEVKSCSRVVLYTWETARKRLLKERTQFVREKTLFGIKKGTWKELREKLQKSESHIWDSTPGFSYHVKGWIIPEVCIKHIIMRVGKDKRDEEGNLSTIYRDVDVRHHIM